MIVSIQAEQLFGLGKFGSVQCMLTRAASGAKVLKRHTARPIFQLGFTWRRNPSAKRASHAHAASRLNELAVPESPGHDEADGMLNDEDGQD